MYYHIKCLDHLFRITFRQELVPSCPTSINISCPFLRLTTALIIAPLEEPRAELPLPPAAPAKIKLEIKR